MSEITSDKYLHDGILKVANVILSVFTISSQTAVFKHLERHSRKKKDDTWPLLKLHVFYLDYKEYARGGVPLLRGQRKIQVSLH